MSMPLCIGMTGGIGSGKTSAAKIFESLGAGIVDTDEIAHELTRAGGAATAAIRAAFGAVYVTADGALDRQKMRALVFSDSASRRKLEGILHPLIRRRALELVRGSGRPYVLLVVPLLLETGACGELVSRVLVIDCDETRQVARASARSGVTAKQVRAIMAAQVSREQRLAAADDVIRNDGDMETLRRQVQALHAEYLALAQEPSRNAVPEHRKSFKKAQ